MIARVPEIALVFSPEPWVESLHRHLTDHGGARVNQFLIDPALVVDEHYDVLVVSHRWPALTLPLVAAIRERDRTILGVYDSSEPASRAFLESLGVDGVIEADAPMPTFVTAVAGLTPLRCPGDGAEAASRPAGPDELARASTRPALVTAVGGPPGTAATEVAIALGAATGGRGCATVLVDADDVAPTVATRLALSLEPNLRTAIDAVEYGLGTLDSSVVGLPGVPLELVVGLPNVATWSQIRAGELLDVIAALRRSHEHVVVTTSSRLEDLPTTTRGRYAIGRAVLADADVLVGVAAPNPVGVSSLVAWVADARALNPDASLHLAILRAPRDAFRRREVATELERSCEPDRLWFLPADRRVDTAEWGSLPVPIGPFVRAVRGLGDAIVPRARPHTERPRRRRLAVRVAR